MQSMNEVGKQVASGHVLVQPEANVYWTQKGSGEFGQNLGVFLVIWGNLGIICKEQ